MWLLEMKEANRVYTIKFAVKQRSEGTSFPRTLTYQAKDVADGGHTDDEQIDQGDETKRDGDVYGPAERLVGEKDLKHGPADLQREGRKEVE